jgi:hypothetical protein
MLAPGDDVHAGVPFGHIPLPHERAQLSASEMAAAAAGSRGPTESVTAASVARLPSATHALVGKFTRQASALAANRAAAAAAAGSDGGPVPAGVPAPAPAGPAAAGGSAPPAAPLSPARPTGGRGLGSPVGALGRQRTLRAMAMASAGVRQADGVTPDTLLSAHVAQLSDTLPPELAPA